MDLEDARIIAPQADVYRLRPRRNPAQFEQWEWTYNRDLKLSICRYWLAATTIQRHLPVPLTLSFEYYYGIGIAIGRGARYLPLRED